MQNEKNEKLTQTIRWTRQRIKEVYPTGGRSMTAALNLWHVLRGKHTRHGCRFDYVWEYRHAVTYLLRKALDAEVITAEERIDLWEKLVDIPVSRIPEGVVSPESWKRMPGHYTATLKPAAETATAAPEEPMKKTFLQRWLRLG